MVSGKLDLQKKQHRERSQPLHRKKLGLLEKHADYVKRARDFHSKEDRIQKLREKAAMRNKDEFYFGMIKSRTKGGVHIQSRGNEALPVDLVKVLKTQDAGYIRSQATMEQGRVERLQQQLDALVDTALPTASTSKAPAGGDDEEVMMGEDDWDMYDDDFDEPAKPKRNHVVFTDDLDAVRCGDSSSLLRKRSTPTALPSASTSSATAFARRKSKSKGKGKALQVEEAEEKEQRAKDAERIAEEAKIHRESLEQELAARQTRLVQLHRAARELDLQRALMGKGAKQGIVKSQKDAGRERRNEEWWLGGGKKGTGSDGAGKGGLPEAEEGVGTGARVWKWKAQRKR
ncbi:hypothetical protein JCM6882_001826 [Rhodosporidiobolus microsporus]